jgi:hypothetical protein
VKTLLKATCIPFKKSYASPSIVDKETHLLLNSILCFWMWLCWQYLLNLCFQRENFRKLNRKRKLGREHLLPNSFSNSIEYNHISLILSYISNVEARGMDLHSHNSIEYNHISNLSMRVVNIYEIQSWLITTNEIPMNIIKNKLQRLLLSKTNFQSL